MTMSSLSLFPSLLFFLLISTTALATTTNVDLVDKTCKESSKSSPNIDYTFCYNALQSVPSSNGADLTRLGLISINLVKKNCSNTKSLIKSLLKNNKLNNKSTKAALKDCSELYSDSISTLGEAISDYKAKRFGEANIKVSAVMDSSSTCEQGFEELEVNSPLSRQNSNTFQLSAIALSIMNKLRH